MAREFTGGVQNPGFVLAGFQLHEIEAHVTGRNTAAVEILTGVALLRAQGWIGEHASVSDRGAAYQDARGTPLNPRAHRFPCNPVIGGRSIPELVPAVHSLLAHALKQALAATDILPLEANYADNLFESSGACDAVLIALTKIIEDQPAGNPVDLKIVSDALTRHLLPGFAAAYDEAYRRARETDNPIVPSFSITDPGFAERLSAHAIANPPNPKRPKNNVEGAGDILLFEAGMAARQAASGSLTALLPAVQKRFASLIVTA